MVQAWISCFLLDAAQFPMAFWGQPQFFRASANSGIMDPESIIGFLNYDARSSEMDFAAACIGLSYGAVMNAIGANKAASPLRNCTHLA